MAKNGFHGSNIWRERKQHLMSQPFVHAVNGSNVAMVLADPGDDMPIIFANDAFLLLTGYEEADVLGLNCRFLQTPDVDKGELDKLRAALEARETVTVQLKNARKDGSVFWNELHVAPVWDARGEVMFYVGSQIDVTERVEANKSLERSNERLEELVSQRTADLRKAVEDSTLKAREVTHRVKNSLTLLSALVEVQRRASRNPHERDVLRDIAGRIRAVGRVQGLLEDVGTNTNHVSLCKMLEQLREDLDGTGAAAVRLGKCDDLHVSPAKALPLALALTELVLNAQKHGFEGRDEGCIEMRVEADEILRLHVEDDGSGIPDGFDPYASTGTGMTIVLGQVQQLGAELDWGRSRLGGTRITLELADWKAAED